MIKRISIFIVFSFFLVTLSILHHKVLAAVSNQSNSTSVATFTIQGGNGNDAYDARGNKILKQNQVRGSNLIKLDASLDGRTAELPIGTIIFLHFPKGVDNITINPEKGVVEKAEGTYNLPKGDVAVLKVVGQGSATLTVTYRTVIKNAAGSSYNWSGYERTTGGSFTDITSQWTVPTASSCSSGDTYSSAWVGIDDGSDTNQDLIQTGTESDCVSSSPVYQAWLEILPAAEQPLNTTTYPVSPGDSMFAEVKQNSGSSWTITIKNLSQNWASSSAQTYNGPQSTSEWILERPTVGGSRATLTHYGSTSFINDTQNGANPNHTYSTDSINMLADDGTTVISTPSNPDSLKDAFTVAYGSTQPSAPASWSNNSPSNTNNSVIYGTAASSIQNIWGTGYENVSGQGKMPVTYLYNGASWQKKSPTPVDSYKNHWLYGVATDGSSDAWTVGTVATTGYFTLAYHWNGSSWGSAVTSDNPACSGCVNQFNGVGIDGGGTAWAVGQYYEDSTHGYQPLLEKWNGSKFANQPLTLPSGQYQGYLYGVSFNSSTNGWAAGYSAAGGVDKYLIYHYDGSNWTATSGAISNDAVLNGVTAVSNTEAWADGGKYNGTNWSPLILHYTSANGWVEDTSFSSSFPSGTSLSGVSANSASDVWIVGTVNSTTPFTMHWNGSAWSQVSTPSGNGQLLGVAANSGRAWAGGVFSTNYPLVYQSN